MRVPGLVYKYEEEKVYSQCMTANHFLFWLAPISGAPKKLGEKRESRKSHERINPEASLDQ